MFAPERLRIIKSILIDKNHINVSDLSSMLSVSEVTIRRDLEKLEKDGFLTRTHGGAIINDNYNFDDQKIFEASIDPLINERQEISEIAFHIVEENDVILLTPGVTNLHIAKKLISKKNLTVLTNDLNIASEISVNPSIKVILPGGDLDSSSMILVGKLTEVTLRNFFVSKAFIEADGVSLNRGYTVQSMESASVIKEMIEISSEKIIVCPYKSFDYIAFSQIGPLKLANKVITNPSIPDLYKNYFFENNIQLFTAFNSYKGGM